MKRLKETREGPAALVGTRTTGFSLNRDQKEKGCQSKQNRLRKKELKLVGAPLEEGTILPL